MTMHRKHHMLRSFGLVNSCSPYSRVRKSSQNILVNSRSRDHKSWTREKLSTNDTNKTK